MNVSLNQTKKFTLLELLIVIAIILVLVGMTLPAFSRAKGQAKSSRWNQYLNGIETDEATIALYDFSDGAGSSVLTNSAFGLQFENYFQEGLNGTLINSEIWKRKGKWSGKNAVIFNGTNSYIDCGVGLPLEDESFTISIWCNRYDTGAEMRLLGHGTHGLVNSGLSLGFKADDKFTFDFFGNGLDTTDNFTSTEIYHNWVCTYDNETGERFIYRDGEEVASDISGANYQGDPRSPVTIGTAFPASTPWFFNGAIDDVFILARALDTQEIIALYKAGLP